MTTTRTAIAAARTIQRPARRQARRGERRDGANSDVPGEWETRGGKQETRRGASDRWGGKQGGERDEAKGTASKAERDAVKETRI